MRTNHILSLALLLSLSWCTVSCTQDEETHPAVKEARLEIAPLISSQIETRGEKNQWSQGDSLGLFLTTEQGRLDSPYLGRESYSNVLYSYDGQLWKASHEVNLGVDYAFVYAYYPFRGNADPKSIPVDVKTQTDYLYGKADTLVNYLQKVATIRMKHAMTQFVLELSLGEYDGEGYVSSVKLHNGNSSSYLMESGSLDIQSGEIKGTGASSQTLYTARDVSIRDSKLLLSYILIPTGATQNTGDIRLEITIDGKVFYYDFLYGTNWKAGYKNIYRSALNSNELVIDPDNGIIIEPWIEVTDNPAVELIPIS